MVRYEWLFYILCLKKWNIIKPLLMVTNRYFLGGLEPNWNVAYELESWH